MHKFVCDRCGRTITGNTYYTVDIYGEDINPTNDGLKSSTTASQNISTNMAKIICPEKHYCEKCRDEFENFLRTKPIQNLTKNQKRVLSKIAFHKWFKENG